MFAPGFVFDAFQKSRTPMFISARPSEDARERLKMAANIPNILIVMFI
jgi:hypothetical protein